MWIVVLLSVVVFGLGMALLAVGVIITGRPMRRMCSRTVSGETEPGCDECTCQGPQVIPPESLVLRKN